MLGLSRRGRRVSSTRESRAAGAVTITRHGALLTTYLVISPTQHAIEMFREALDLPEAS